MNIRPSIVCLAISLAAVPCAVQAQQAGDIVTTNIVLNGDIEVASAYISGLTVGADNIVIDGNGHSLVLTVPPTSYGKGIVVGAHTNVTLRNVRIRGFFRGIEATGGNGLRVEHCRLENLANAAISLQNHSHAAISNCVFRDSSAAVTLFDSSLSRFAGNTVIGSRGALVANNAITPGTLTDNLFLHQSNDYPNSHRRRMIRFTATSRQVAAGEKATFSLNLSSLTGESAAQLVCVARTVPETETICSRDGNTVNGSFVPERTGMHAILASVTDTYGNREERMVKVLVGPAVPAQTVYYMGAYHAGPLRGQALVMLDNAGMQLTPPSGLGDFRCGAWVDWYPDAVPPMPAGLLRKIEIKTLLQFDSGNGLKTEMGVHRTGPGANPSVRVTVPPALGSDEIEWGEFELGPLSWFMDYPNEWFFLTLTFLAPQQNPRIHVGNPLFYGRPEDQVSRTVFHSLVGATPEVRALSDPRTLLLAATADPRKIGSDAIAVWGHNDETDVHLASFRRPFRNATTRIQADGDAVLSTGLVAGEQTLLAVPMEIFPTADSVSVAIVEWTDNGRLVWTETPIGTPGPVGHTVDGLAPGQPYHARANGQPLAVFAANGSGQIQFDYAGGFPVTLEIDLVSDVAITTPADGARFPEPATLDIEAAVSGTLGDLARVEFFCGETKLGEATASPYRIAWTGVPAGNHPLTAVAVSADGIAYTSAVVRIAVVAPHIILASAGPGGTIQPEGAVETPDGADRTFIIAPEIGHVVRDVRVDGVPIGAATNHTFLSVTNAHSIEALFHEVRFEGMDIHPANGQWVLRFDSLSNRWYDVLYKNDLLDTNDWQVLADNPVAGTGHPLEIADPDPPARRFYRLRLRE